MIIYYIQYIIFISLIMSCSLMHFIFAVFCYIIIINEKFFLNEILCTMDFCKKIVIIHQN